MLDLQFFCEGVERELRLLLSEESSRTNDVAFAEELERDGLERRFWIQLARAEEFVIEKANERRRFVDYVESAKRKIAINVAADLWLVAIECFADLLLVVHSSVEFQRSALAGMNPPKLVSHGHGGWDDDDEGLEGDDTQARSAEAQLVTNDAGVVDSHPTLQSFSGASQRDGWDDEVDLDSVPRCDARDGWEDDDIAESTAVDTMTCLLSDESEARERIEMDEVSMFAMLRRRFELRQVRHRR